MTAREQSPTAESLEPTPQHVNELLDEALEESFPASDPVAVHIEPAPKRQEDPPLSAEQ